MYDDDANESDGPKLGDLRHALSKPAIDSSQRVIDFMLNSSWTAGLRLNFLGWVLRGVFLLIAFVAMLSAPEAWLILVMPFALFGWLLAGLELFRDDIILARRNSGGLSGAIATHLASSRASAMPSLSGVTEALTAVLLVATFIRPIGWLTDLPVPVGSAFAWFFDLVTLQVTDTWRSIGVLALAGYAAVALAQALTDAGYNNHEPGREPAWWVRGFRWVSPFVYIAICLAVMAAGGVASGWLEAAVVTMYLATALLPVVSDNIQAAATHSHLELTAQSHRDLGAELSEEIHRVSMMLHREATQADLQGNHELGRTFERVFAEVDSIRARANSSGGIRRPATLQAILDLLHRKSDGYQRPVLTTSTPDVVLSHGGASLVRHIVLDLTANAFQAGATEVSVDAHVESLRTRLGLVTLVVTDNGPGFPEPTAMNVFPAGSSRQALATLCRTRRGRLTYERTVQHTIATAVFRTDLWAEQPESEHVL